MDDSNSLAEQFETYRPHLRAVAYRMLGSVTETDDAVQAAWERVSAHGADEVENLKAWLTTVVSRICLNMLRSRNTRREDSLDASIPDPLITMEGELDPEEEAVLADSVGLALQVVLDTLSPAERLAFVLHDMFDLPFEIIAPMVGRTPQATRQLASRARRRVKGSDISTIERDLHSQRAVVDAFFAAGRAGDFDSLVGILDPNVVLRADFSPSRPERSTIVRGAQAIARRARLGVSSAKEVHTVLVNSAAGVVITRHGRPLSVMAFTIRNGKILEINSVGDPQRVERLTAGIFANPTPPATDDDASAPAASGYFPARSATGDTLGKDPDLPPD